MRAVELTDDYRWLEDGHTTTAERFKEAGYATFLWASNPHLASDANFTQGFDVEHHPWDRLHRSHASNIVREKVRNDRATTIGRSGGASHLRPWHLSASGRLAQPTLAAWLDGLGDDRPWFAFVNLMEAHQPYIPPRKYRARMMDEAAVQRSYRQNRGPAAWWGFVFGFFDYSEYDLDVLGGTYDATLAELDDLFHGLVQELDRRGLADDTVVVLTADHGEHLGEHHLLDHQYALYQPVLHVPLVVRAPGRIEPGVDARPVMNFDLHPTLLELAGLAPAAGTIDALSLLRPDVERERISMHPATFPVPFRHARQHDPDFDLTPFRRRFEALRRGELKLIRSSLGERELFDLAADPAETEDLSTVDRSRTREIDARLTSWRNERPRRERERESAPTLSEQQRRRLRALGYAE